MMDFAIFCPNCSHFLGQQDKCPGCGWERPPEQVPTGQLCWSVQIPVVNAFPGVPPFPARLARGKGVLFLTTENGYVVALDAEKGEMKWHRTIRPDCDLRTLQVVIWRNLLLLGTEHMA